MKAHGIMFHHFHDAVHPPGQGSISSDDFRDLLAWLRRNYRVLDARSFYELALAGALGERDTCLTFDDSLLCQYEVAAPILEEQGLTAFYFVYSSAFTEHPDMLEVYRYFRSTAYPDFNAFSDEFMAQVALRHETSLSSALSGFDPDSYLLDFPFYSTNDRLFRYVRDHVLTLEQYADVMSGLMNDHDFDVTRVLPLLFMSRHHLMDLRNRGNVVGLHSHTHPLDMETLPVASQLSEYVANQRFLESVLDEAPTSMSHPMGRYSEVTLQILSDLGVRIGFRSSLSVKQAPSLLEIPREDHTNVLERMRS